jgi:hypothetical protein
MLSEEHTLRVFENRVLRRIFGHKMDGEEGRENCVMRGSIICSLH